MNNKINKQKINSLDRKENFRLKQFVKLFVRPKLCFGLGRKFSFLKTKNSQLSTNQGFSLIELLIYISALSMILFIVTNSLMLMTDSYANLKRTQRINQTAMSIMERIVIETRWSNGLSSVGNVFNVDTGSLTLNVIDESEIITEVRFYIDGNDLKMQEGLNSPVVLNLPSVDVNRFFLNFVDNGLSNLIKIELELSSERNGTTKTETFYNSVVMRESY